MEPEGSIPNSQQLSTCSYPEPDQSSPHHTIPSIPRSIKRRLISLTLNENLEELLLLESQLPFGF
jgi:hypothetical protein